MTTTHKFPLQYIRDQVGSKDLAMSESINTTLVDDVKNTVEYNYVVEDEDGDVYYDAAEDYVELDLAQGREFLSPGQVKSCVK